MARNHLLHRLSASEQARWLQVDSQIGTPRVGLRRQATPDQSAGIFSTLIPHNVSPTDAVRIAERLRAVSPDRVTAAIGRLHGINEEPDLGRKDLQEIRDQVLEWTDYLERILADTGTRGQDRVMLLAAAFLEGAPLEVCIKAATAFDPHASQARQRFREGRSPRRRLRDVGVDVTEADTATFSSRPGLAMAAIRTDWHHWADERTQTREWLELITSAKAVAENWTKQVGERLLDLSRTATDPPFFSVLESWVSAPDIDDDRSSIIAELLTQAALTEELTRDVHSRLLTWTKRSPSQRIVVARVCAGKYGLRWPQTALVRIRHLLAKDDEASQIASAVLANHAQNRRNLERIVKTIDSWLEKYPNHPAGPRAFLALTDPSIGDGVSEAHSISVLGTLITLAQSSPEIRDFLISGWAITLQQPEVREAAYRTLVNWSEAVHDSHLDRDFTFGLLTDVRNAHTPLDAMSRFLYGSPDHDAPAVINARFALANLNSNSHLPCTRPNCLISNPNGPSEAGTVEQTDPSSQEPGSTET
ncbi:hypothetical protein [Actinomadura harenae]|uniref:hypothetical protein n=1 Tax=Actinomadura harenae TaxID=2483351 RepID=UPI0011C42847|nr:hypothetical protein [Actinomadura harenae]